MNTKNWLLSILCVLLSASLYFSCQKDASDPQPAGQELSQQAMFAELAAATQAYQAEFDPIRSGERSPICGYGSANVQVIVSTPSPASLLAVTISDDCGNLLASYNSAGTYYFCGRPGATYTVAATVSTGSTYTVKLRRVAGTCGGCAIYNCSGTVQKTITVTRPPSVVLDTYNVDGCATECE